MDYRELLKKLQKLSEYELNQMVKIYDYETDTVREDLCPGFGYSRPDEHYYISIN